MHLEFDKPCKHLQTVGSTEELRNLLGSLEVIGVMSWLISHPPHLNSLDKPIEGNEVMYFR
jgi:hypothetical protein